MDDANQSAVPALTVRTAKRDGLPALAALGAATFALAGPSGAERGPQRAF